MIIGVVLSPVSVSSKLNISAQLPMRNVEM